jgi:hypothetical protein
MDRRWNSRDLERVPALYAEDCEMTSDRIPALGFDASGTVRGKPRQRRGVLSERAGCEDLRVPAPRCSRQDQARLRQSSGALVS